MKAILAVLVLVGMSMTMIACNTSKGVGQDMQSGGRSIENSADRHGATP